MTTVLTNGSRNVVVAGVIEATFRERHLRLRQREHALAVRLLRHAYGDDAFERMAALPEGWLATTRTVRFDGEGTVHGRCQVELDEYTRVPFEVTCGVPLPAPLGWVADLADLRCAQADLADDERRLRSQVGTVLASFRTVEALAEGWPEGFAHLPIVVPRDPLPAVRVDDLNAAIAAARDAA